MRSTRSVRGLKGVGLALFVLSLSSGCAGNTHLLYSISTDYAESGRQYVWPYFLDGKPTVMAFWNTDVAQCLRDIPALKTLDYRETAQLVTVVTGLDRMDIENWIYRERVQFVVLLDLDEKFASMLGVSGYPTFIYFDTQGKEIGRYYNIKSVANWFDKPRWLQRSGAEQPYSGSGQPYNGLGQAGPVPEAKD